MKDREKTSKSVNSCIRKLSMSYAFVFICQPGHLEIKTILLTISLKYFLKCDHELIVVIPRPASVWGEPDKLTLDVLDKLGVRIFEINNEISSPRHPGGGYVNKTFCFQTVRTNKDKIIFLDSDMLCLRDFFDNHDLSAAFNARLAASSTEGRWEDIFKKTNIPMPEIKHPATFSGESIPPYFNSGFICVAKEMAFRLGSEWLRSYKILRATDIMADNMAFEEQVALTLALVKLKLKYNTVTEKYNYPLSLRKKISKDQVPYFCHYHAPETLKHSLFILTLIKSFMHQYPESKLILKRQRGFWKDVVNNGPMFIKLKYSLV